VRESGESTRGFAYAFDVRKWTADISVDAILVRSLITQSTSLEIRSLKRVAEGWDRSVWLANREWAFGFPRQETAVAGIAREIATLPRLAPLLEVSIPVPEHVVVECAGFPWPFFGWRYLAGDELASLSLDDRARTHLSLELARFLRRLHGADVANFVSANDLPVDPSGRANMPHRVRKAREYVEGVERLGLWEMTASLAAAFVEAEQLGVPLRSPTLVHGDLHVQHILVDGGSLSGVIDWANICRADPSVDLQLVWAMTPPPARAEFAAVYGPIANDQWLRARVLAASIYGALALYAEKNRRQHLQREAIAALDRIGAE
jgi:aminoglycoside phosphotransferase (APT) family kinase protein